MGMGLAKIIPKWPIVSGWLWWNPAKSHPTNDHPPRNWTPTSTDLPTFLVLPTKLRGWTSGKCKAWTSLEIPLGSDRFFASFLQDLKVIFAQKGPIQVLRVSFKVLILEWTWVNFHELCGPWWYFFICPLIRHPMTWPMPREERITHGNTYGRWWDSIRFQLETTCLWNIEVRAKTQCFPPNSWPGPFLGL